MSDTIASRRIHLLREDVANRIAAGEVIDRPLSVVRELVDNALDAGARSVDVRIRRGGLDEVVVSDDGQGMGPEDLELCHLPHATSKIETVDDLRRAVTLGFRGEALSSIGLCATLEVTSRRPEARSAHRLVVRDGKAASLEPAAGTTGTLVRVSGLFEHLPARRQFLKSAGAESGQCAAVFLDKAVAFPAVSFRYYADDDLRHFLPAAVLEERVLQAYPHAGGGAALRIRGGEGRGVSAQIVMARPEAARRDRKLIQVFANGRRIWDFSLLQAVEYGYSGAVPGGLHPVAFVFLSVDPSVVDFNVHPAKREARFADLPAIHRLVASVVKECVREWMPRLPDVAPSGRAVIGSPARETALFSAAEEEQEPLTRPSGAGGVADGRAPPTVARERGAVRYIGQVFGLFLAVERDDRLYLVDQHAAHERIIFDRLMSQPPALQDLLLPVCFDPGPSEAAYAAAHSEELRAAGVVAELHPGGSCEVISLDSLLGEVPEEELADIVCGRRGEPGLIRRALCASAACARAVRDGEVLDPATALELAEEALGLPEPRCPHGRPVWHSLSKGELFRLVKREI